jgi:plasmid stability protein
MSYVWLWNDWREGRGGPGFGPHDPVQRRARRHGRSTEEEVREILRNAVKSEGNARTHLGSRIAARFRRTGLEGEIPELRGPMAS